MWKIVVLLISRKCFVGEDKIIEVNNGWVQAEGTRIRGRIERKVAYLHELQTQVFNVLQLRGRVFESRLESAVKIGLGTCLACIQTKCFVGLMEITETPCHHHLLLVA